MPPNKNCKMEKSFPCCRLCCRNMCRSQITLQRIPGLTVIIFKQWHQFLSRSRRVINTSYKGTVQRHLKIRSITLPWPFAVSLSHPVFIAKHKPHLGGWYSLGSNTRWGQLLPHTTVFDSATVNFTLVIWKAFCITCAGQTRQPLSVSFAD